MKHFLLATVTVIALLMCEAAQAASDLDPFHACVNREAKAALRRALEKAGEMALYGYQNAVDGEVFRTCKQRAFDGSNRSDVDDYTFVNTVVEKQTKEMVVRSMLKADEEQRRKAALDAPRLKAEKAVEDQAASIYFACLDNHARVLAVKSNEPAEVIAQASFASCRTERQGVFDAYRGHTNSFYPETMAAAEQVFQRQLLLVVIEARASHDAQPVPAPAVPPTKRGTPI